MKGIFLSGGPLRGVEVVRNVITSNDFIGIDAQRTFDQDMPLRLEGNLIAGNHAGARLAEGAVDFVNNTVIWNRGLGYVSKLSSPIQRERVVNNLFTGNGNAGYFREFGWTNPTFAHNEVASLDLPASPQRIVLRGGSELAATVEHRLRSPEDNHGLHLALLSDELNQRLDATLASDDSQASPVLGLLLLPEPGAGASAVAASLTLALLARSRFSRAALRDPPPRGRRHGSRARSRRPCARRR